MVERGLRCALVLALVVVVLAACGTGSKNKKKRRGSDDRSTATATASRSSTPAAERVLASPSPFTMRGDLTVSYEGCRPGQQVEFGWRDRRTGRSGVLGSTVPCQGASAVLRLPQFTGPAAGRWEVTGKITGGGSKSTALTTHPALVTPEQPKQSDELTLAYYGCDPGTQLSITVRGAGPDSTPKPTCKSDGSAVAPVRHTTTGVVTVTTAEPDGTPMTATYTVR
ncbi:hypothetical protein ACIRPK_09810 [Kitasatospora sp. NPDC101801]|uniref:hypothetical protein n=1 Tax=Kitasatospora sp. NPDC101801 TaxID=3364103 RepID=UPI003802F796